MAVEAAIEALRAIEDLVSQTKMGQLFELLDLQSRLQVLLKVFWQLPCVFFSLFHKCDIFWISQKNYYVLILNLKKKLLLKATCLEDLRWYFD